MQVIGIETVQTLIDSGGYVFKIVASDAKAIFFPVTTEHRDAKVEGLSYEENYAGNAIAGMVKFGIIEFRYHRAFSDSRVRLLAERLLSTPECAFASGFAVSYQGRLILTAQGK